MTGASGRETLPCDGTSDIGAPLEDASGPVPPVTVRLSLRIGISAAPRVTASPSRRTGISAAPRVAV
ncbi:hypothetical protein AB0I98_48440 [Streptomyces sp. NPDC050211]|uniref:hypothetical protein n=1 Tax=Streptomyces sp. NPDC050211 TaxID=3154932 RepID=UPI00343A76F8